MNIQKGSVPAHLGKFVWYFLRHHKLAIFSFIVVSFIWAFEMSISPYLLKLIIDTVNDYEQMPSQLAMAVMVPAILYASMSLVLNLTFRFYNYVCLRVFPQIKRNVTNVMFEYLSQHSHAYFQTHFSGTLVKKINDLSVSIEPVIQIPNEMFIPRIIALLVASSFMFIVHPMFAVTLSLWAIAFVWMSYFMAKGSEDKSYKFADAIATFNGALVDSVTNMMSAKIFSNTPYEAKRIDQNVLEVVDKDRALQWYMLKLYFIQGLFITLLISTLMIGLVHGRIQGWVSIGDFAFVLTLAVYFIHAVYSMGQEMIRFAKEVGTCRQALSILTVAHEIKDAPNALPYIPSKGEIKLEEVHFSYDNTPTLKNINLFIGSGEKVGLVGYSGGGKSTFVKLLIRLHDVDSGTIRLDNQAIETMTLASLRQGVSFIPQDPELFHRSIMDNIRYGNLEATDDEVIEASKKAHCHEFVSLLDDGYASLVGERGVKLSGGQKQRIAIARAILKNAPILILDEATSALDSVTESYIQDSLHEMMTGKTTIVIAHRLSTLSEMDRILFFKEGQIIEDGTFDQLMSLKDGHFRKLWQMQAGGFIDDMSS